MTTVHLMPIKRICCEMRWSRKTFERRRDADPDFPPGVKVGRAVLYNRYDFPPPIDEPFELEDPDPVTDDEPFMDRFRRAFDGEPEPEPEPPLRAFGRHMLEMARAEFERRKHLTDYEKAAISSVTAAKVEALFAARPGLCERIRRPAMFSIGDDGEVEIYELTEREQGVASGPLVSVGQIMARPLPVPTN